MKTPLPEVLFKRGQSGFVCLKCGKETLFPEFENDVYIKCDCLLALDSLPVIQVQLPWGNA